MARKLTKPQVRIKLKTAANKIWNCIIDKYEYPDSYVSISKPKLMEIHDMLKKAEKRTMRK